MLEETRSEAGKQPESLEDSVEACEEHDPAEEERDLATPGCTVEVAIPVGGEEGEYVVDRIAGGEGVVRLPPASETREGGGTDTVGAVECEDGVEDAEELTRARFRTLLLSIARV